MERSIEEMLLKLISVQGDTGTDLERDVARTLHDLILENPYFRENPGLSGAWVGEDHLDSPLVWALRRGEGQKTVILLGHYDTVEIDSYGPLKHLALDPFKLREALRKEAPADDRLRADLDDERWLFGRGAADMKAGLAINLYTLFSADNVKVNILFLALPDEENLSAGARQSLELLGELKGRFNLDYSLALLSEPQFRDGEAGRCYSLIGGSMGKILPVVLVKGVLTHAAEIYRGLNPSLVLAEIVKRVELSPDFVSEDRGISCPPPTTLYFRDTKKTYDVSVPEYAALFFNIFFLRSRPPASILEALQQTCREAVEAALEKHRASSREMARRGLLAEGEERSFQPRVVSFGELKAEAETHRGFLSFRENLLRETKRQSDQGLHLPGASLSYLEEMLRFLGTDEPTVVVGLAPPYYPAVTNEKLAPRLRAALDAAVDYLQEERGVVLEELPYMTVMCDLSYLSCRDPLAERALLREMILPADFYDLPVEEMAHLNVPSFILGPLGRDMHQLGERVFLPDVRETIPRLQKVIMANL